LRALFLVLLLANLLFLAWTQWVVPPARRSRAEPSGAALETIQLASESAPARAQPTGTVLDDLSAAPCVSVGPFAGEPQAMVASAALERLGFTSRSRQSNDEVRVGTWVRVPDLATAEDATNALTALRRAGLSDVFIVSDGEPVNTVSVGVYNDAHKAQEMAQKVAQAGLTPQLTDRRRTLDVYWLDIDRQANRGLPPLDVLGAGNEGGLPLEMRSCPRSAPSAP
jgi:hypothetical protein